jgi:oligopeptide transport system ATP-binding protein
MGGVVNSTDRVLEITDLRHEFDAAGGARVQALDGVSFALDRGEVVALVGESGSGKSTLARCAVRLLEPTAGRIELLGTDVTHLGRRAMRPLRREVHMVLQDALAAMNPRMTVGQVVAEPLRLHGIGDRAARHERAHAMLARVGLRQEFADRYPHELSGGQRQRVGIARALVLGPSLLVADEPVSALDVSVRASILNLLAELQQSERFACLFITHDLSIVQHVADRVAVMYLGRIVEQGTAQELFDHPQHPYTQALMSAAPLPNPRLQRARSRIVLRGDIPSPAAPPSGCHFHTRCPLAFDRCTAEAPELQPLAGEGDRLVRCHCYLPGSDVPRLGSTLLPTPT